MVDLKDNLDLDRCPHCNVNKPNIHKQWETTTTDSGGGPAMFWRIYRCQRCGKLVTAWANQYNMAANAVYPEPVVVDDDVPDKPKEYLTQAIESIHTPAGAVMLAASAVDAMLKIKGYTDGSLYNRIEKATEEHLITEDMKNWAHEIRLDANDQRHADINATLPEENDAKRVIEFAQALGMFLFVLPARIQRGLADNVT